MEKRLAPALAEVAVKCWFNGLDTAQTAVFVGCPESAVYNTLAYVREQARLRKVSLSVAAACLKADREKSERLSRAAKKREAQKRKMTAEQKIEEACRLVRTQEANRPSRHFSRKAP